MASKLNPLKFRNYVRVWIIIVGVFAVFGGAIDESWAVPLRNVGFILIAIGVALFFIKRSVKIVLWIGGILAAGYIIFEIIV